MQSSGIYRGEMLTILKLGGSVITHKDSGTPSLNEVNLKRVAKEIKDGMRGSLIVVHGAGSYGHPHVARSGINEGIIKQSQLHDFAECQRLQNILNASVCGALLQEGVPAMPFQASAAAVMVNKKLDSLSLAALRGCLSIGLVPVLYGTPAFDASIKGSILSGDALVAYLARELSPEQIVFATDVDGVYDRDPRKCTDAKLVRSIKKQDLDSVSLSGSSHTDVTGGMMGKIARIMDPKGVTCQIINGTKEGRIRDSLLGKDVLGTNISF